MSSRITQSVEARWARLGLLLHCAPARATPDIERLLLDTARGVETNARLHTLAVTWLVAHGLFVARHRLKRLSLELRPEHQAALGLLIEDAVALGASRELAVAAENCRPLARARPLFAVQRGDADLEAIAERHASPLSLQWGVWAPGAQLKHASLRPATWILAHNPSLAERAVRKGDLRASILEVLRRDVPGRLASTSQVARLCSVTRTAARKAVAALVREGAVVVAPTKDNKREHAITLAAAA